MPLYHGKFSPRSVFQTFYPNRPSVFHRERICALEDDELSDDSAEFEKHVGSATARPCLQSPTRAQWNMVETPGKDVIPLQNGPCKQNYNGRTLYKSPSICASKCVS